MKFIIFCSLALSLASTADSFKFCDTVRVPQGRIANGQNATQCQFPYMVGLSVKIDPESATSYWCGGSLISNEWVLTVAHCTKTVKQATVYLGATDRRYPQVKHIVSSENFIVHPGYNNLSLKNDIALIKIPSTNLTTHIKHIRLPSLASINTTYTGKIAVMSGWGVTGENTTKNADHLQWATFRIISNSVCARTYGIQVAASNICIATSAGVTNCKGDSGGPLVLQSSNIQIGVDSFSYIPGCQKGKPAGFTRITSYLEWIKQHTGISY